MVPGSGGAQSIVRQDDYCAAKSGVQQPGITAADVEGVGARQSRRLPGSYPDNKGKEAVRAGKASILRRISAMKKIVIMLGCLGALGCQQANTRINLERQMRRSGLAFDTVAAAGYTIGMEQPALFPDSVYQNKVARAIGRCKQVLETDSLHFRFTYVFVNSPEDMGKMANEYEGQGIAFLDDNVVLEQAHSASNGFGAHELFHVAVYRHTGAHAKDAFTSEGFAVFSDDKWWGHDLHGMANYIVSRKEFGIAEIIRDFRQNELVSYPVAGSFIKFLYERYGLQTVLHGYRNGITEIESFTGRKLEDLEKEWREEIMDKDTERIVYPLIR